MPPFFEVSVGAAWTALVLQAPIYFFLHIYIEAVMPDAYGVTETCCFCLRRGKRNYDDEDPDMDDFDLTSSINDEKAGLVRDSQDEQSPAKSRLIDPESMESQQRQSLARRNTEGRKAFNKSDPIQLKKMSMLFGEFRAVDKLTMSIKSDEIIALLGHNGAGKTTAIYMLTGMLMPSEGDALIHGNSIKRDTDLVRRSIGLCQQHDVLYDLVSVEEHLRITMRIRMNEINEQNENEKIAEILRQVMLTEHREKLVKELSGGMKRKLSLGMALIGGTQTIILDEPTSGLDVESRQQVW